MPVHTEKSMCGLSEKAAIFKPKRYTLRETRPCWHFDLGLLASGTAPQSVELCYGNPNKLI